MKATYFISGHGNVTEKEFKDNYVPMLLRAAAEDNSKFVVGDFIGVDIMAQNFLINNLSISPDRITVYHMFGSPRNKNEKIHNVRGGFTSDDERDSAMTENSDYDIAFVKDPDRLSGTAKNILRRHKMK